MPALPTPLHGLTHVPGPAPATAQGSLAFSKPAARPRGLGWHPELVVSVPRGFLSLLPSELGCELLVSWGQLMALYFLEGPAGGRGRGQSLQLCPVRL